MKYVNEFGFDEEIYQYMGNSQTPLLHALAGISFPSKNYEIERENARCYSIEYVIDGEGAIQHGDYITKVSKGDFFILHPNTFHHYYSSRKQPWKKIFLLIDCDTSLLDALFDIYKLKDIVFLSQTNTDFGLEKIFSLIKNDNGDIHTKFEQLVFILISNIAKYVKTNASDNSTMNLAKQFIDRRIYTRIPVQEVAAYVNLHPKYFSRTFKKTFEISPIEYITKKKIEQSLLLLDRTQMSVKQISDALAFNDTAHFSNSFKRNMGMTVSEYRKELLSKNNISE